MHAKLVAETAFGEDICNSFKINAQVGEAHSIFVLRNDAVEHIFFGMLLLRHVAETGATCSHFFHDVVCARLVIRDVRYPTGQAFVLAAAQSVGQLFMIGFDAVVSTTQA